MKDRRVDAVVNDDGIAQVQAELLVLRATPFGLEVRRVCEVVVELQDATIGAVVEAAVRGDRAVHAVHHPRSAADKAPQPSEVEVERVEEADRRRPRQAVHLHGEAAALQLSE